MTKNKKIFIIIGFILIGGWLIYNYLIPYGWLIFLSIHSHFLHCPEGYEKFSGLMGSYCATNSQKPCSSHADCPENEQCISKDGKYWFCSGRKTGCYFWNPENPQEGLCVD